MSNVSKEGAYQSRADLGGSASLAQSENTCRTGCSSVCSPVPLRFHERCLRIETHSLSSSFVQYNEDVRGPEVNSLELNHGSSKGTSLRTSVHLKSM